MDLDSKGLARLRRVANPRDVWTSESGDFTPWLAANLDLLADALGTTLTLVGTEVVVGGFRLDIEAADDEGRVVVIENQLERSDHGHLGQCILYAAGRNAAYVVWVAPQFREDSRRALEWLNSRTDEGLGFFAVEVSVVEIGEGGPRAPVFEVVVRPSDWQKEQKGQKDTSLAGVAASTSPLNELRQDFFADVMTDVSSARPAIKVPSRSSQNWVSFASGPFGYWALSAAAKGRLRVEAYIDMGSGSQALNKLLFDHFRNESPRWELAAGGPLQWERLDERRASRIADYIDLNLDDDVVRDAARKWAASRLIAMFDALNQPLREHAKILRDAQTGPAAGRAVSAMDDASDELRPGEIATS